MVKWTYLSYRQEPWLGATEDVRLWFESLPLAVQAAISGQLGVARVQPLRYWQERGMYKALKGQQGGIEELRFELRENREARKESYRIFGFCSSESNEFTMLVGFRKTRGITDYEEYGAIALERKAKVKADKRYTTKPTWLENYD